MRYLSLCIIVKDEDRALREWVAHHALLGVEHFFIFDNESRVPVARAMRGFPPQLFTVINISGIAQQLLAYTVCLSEFGHTSRWIGFIDADEFLFPVHGNDLRPVLAEFEPYAGLAVPWTMFGASGHTRPPKGLLTESYLHRYPDHATGWHQIIKCLVNPASVLGVEDPHRFLLREGQHLVNEQHIPVTPGSNRTIRSCNRLQLNHYFFKSKEEWEQKLARGRADRADEAGRYPASLFEDQARTATQLDKRILRFVPGVRAALANPASLSSLLPGPSGPSGPAGPAQELPPPLSLDDAVARCMEAVQAGQIEAAQILLCQAAATQGHAAELWLLRAMLARLTNQWESAAFLIRQALLRAESPQIYLELLRIAHATGRREEARGALLCFNAIIKQQNAEAEWRDRQAEAAKLVASMG